MWTPEEKQRLIELYPVYKDSELCSLLDKTPGQIRGMKERLGLNQKHNRIDDERIGLIQDWYNDHPDDIDLSELSERTNIPIPSISRIARKYGLTNPSRSLTEKARAKLSQSISSYYSSEYFQTVGRAIVSDKTKKQLAISHPRGMLGKHHSESTRKAMSCKHKEIWDNMTDDERASFCDRIRQGNIMYHRHSSGINTYSRCRGGKRDDLDSQYFRSAWEANVARILNYRNIKWVYEPKRFIFEDVDRGALSYLPDFYLPELDIWIEVKGWFDDRSITSLNLFREQYPDEYENLVVIDEKLYKKLTNGFKGLIPTWE